MAAFVLALAVVAVAELGDKSQLLTLGFATRQPALPVLVGVSVATALVHGLSVLVGSSLADVLPERPLGVIAGVAFLGVALWTWRAPDEPGGAGARTRSGRWVAVTIALAFLAAEIGDKTMLATMALAVREDPVGTWAGATAGTVAVNGLAVAVGRQLGARVTARPLRLAGTAAFSVAGLAVLVNALLA